MRIWMEEHYGEKDHFALKITLYLLRLLAFAITMPVGVTWLALYFKWPITEVTLTTCIVDVILVVWLARECGHRVHRYCTVFCQDDRGGLFAVDIGKFAGYIGASRLQVPRKGGFRWRQRTLAALAPVHFARSF